MGSLKMGGACKTESDYAGERGRIQNMGSIKQAASSDQEQTGQDF